MQILISKDCHWRPSNDEGILYFTADKFTDNGEIYIKLGSGVAKAKEVLVIHSLFPDPNTRFMELVLIVNALRVRDIKVRLLLPYICYSRQDRITIDSDSIGFLAVLDTLRALDVEVIFTFDLHAFYYVSETLMLNEELPKMMQRSYDYEKMPVVQIVHTCALASALLNPDEDKNWLAMVITDNGARPMTSLLANIEIRESADYAFISKSRYSDGSMSMELDSGNVKDKTCFLIYDIVDSGKTLCMAARLLKANGAKRVVAYATHAVLSGDAKCLIDSCESIDKFLTTDTIIKRPGYVQNTSICIVETLIELLQTSWRK